MVLAYLQQLDPPIIPNLQHLGFGNADCCRVPNCRTNRKYWDLALHEKKHVGAASYYHTCVTQDTSLPQTRYCVQQDGKGGYYWNSSSTARIGELILGFFYYYGFEFNFRRNGVSLKNGGVVEKLKGQPYFYIEDPFLAGVNVA
jgi:DNA polymerase sigma